MVRVKTATQSQSYCVILTDHHHDTVIKSCSTVKLLGVTVNNNLSWSDHIETVIKKCKTYLYMLSQIS